MSKFSKLDGQDTVVMSVLLESIAKGNSSPAPMTIADFAKAHKVDQYIKKPSEETIKKAEKELGVKFGPQLKNYLLTYGGISYKFIEFEGLAENSNRIVTITQNARSLGLDKKFIVVYKIHDEGAYACVDSSDKVYEVNIYAGKVTVKDMKMKFEEYFIHTMKNYKLLKESTEIPEILTEAATRIADIKSESEFKKKIDALYKDNVEIRTLMLYAVSSAERFLNGWNNDGLEIKYPKMAQVTKMLKSQKNDETGKSGIRGVKVVNGKNTIGENDFVAITEFRGKCVANFTVNNRTAVDAMLLFIQSVPDAEDEIFGFKLNKALSEARDKVKVTRVHA